MYYFLVNKSSASGKSAYIWEGIEKYLKDNDIAYEALYTEHENHAMEIVKGLEDKRTEDKIKLVVIGGDGTFNEVINAIKDFSVFSFGLIPAGSGNDLARGLGISHDYMDNIKRILLGEVIKKCDLGKVTFPDGKSRYFGISAGLGLDAEVCYFALKSKLKAFLNKIHLGEATYMMLTILRLFSMRTCDIKLRVDDEAVSYEKMIFTAAMNHKCEGGGVPMAPEALYDDGFLNIISAHNISKIRALISLAILSGGKAKWIKGISYHKIKKAELILSKPMIFHTDGEYAGMYDRAIFTCYNNYMEFMN